MKPFIKQLALWGLLMIIPSVSLAADSKNSTKQPANPGGEIKLQKKADPRGVLTLREVIARVLLHNPELEAFSLEIRAREARALQAGLYKNPEVLFLAEDVLGSGSFKNFKQSQATILLSQVIELGGKRAQREREALSHKDLAFWDFETARMDVLTRVANAYTDALFAQEKLNLTQELVELSQNAYNAVKARVKAGKVSPIQEVKAQIALSGSEMFLQQSKTKIKGTYRRLASFWGSLDPRFVKVSGDFYLIAPIPQFDALSEQMRSNPDLARWAAEMAQRTAAVDLEEANSVPNLKLGAGARWFDTTNDSAFVFELSIPVQLFDRNQGAIAEARHRDAKAKAQRRAVQFKLNAELATRYTRLANSHSRVTSLKTEILPGSQTAFEAVNKGYRFGKFSYLALLDSQRTWFKVRSDFLEALSEYHKAVANIERLTGQAVSPLPETQPQP
jgi:cobalt-zinc-cadmium efflux system outer membrane protein